MVTNILFFFFPWGTALAVLRHQRMDHPDAKEGGTRGSGGLRVERMRTDRDFFEGRSLQTQLTSCTLRVGRHAHHFLLFWGLGWESAPRGPCGGHASPPHFPGVGLTGNGVNLLPRH